MEQEKKIRQVRSVKSATENLEYLKNEDLYTLLLFSEKQKTCELEYKNIEQEFKNLKLLIRQKELELQVLKPKLSYTNRNFKQAKANFQEKQKQNKECVQRISQKYGLSNVNWGYDPETGKILKGDES